MWVVLGAETRCGWELCISRCDTPKGGKGGGSRHIMVIMSQEVFGIIK